jgi:hypothetical protein
MKKIIIILLLAFPFITEAQVFKKLQVQRLKTDTLLLYKVLPKSSDTCLVVRNDTVYWRLCSSINVDTSFFSHVSDTALTIQGWDTTSIINYIAALPADNEYWDSTANVLHPTDTTNAVAIGTNSAPAGTMLRVNDGAVIFEGSTGTTPVSGAGTRMMWIPSKAAFRAGGVSSTQWDNANIGAYSVACGLNNLAGSYSATFGAGNSGINPEYMLISGSANYPYNSRMGALIGDQNGTEYGNTSFLVAGYNNTINASYSATFGYQNKNYSYANLIAGKWCNQLGSNTWVSTDPLMQLGNGSSIANRNDALRILKNGTAYIGDASSTTDPILTVSTTDSTTTLIGILKLTPQDDPPVSASEGMIYADTDHHLYYYNGTAWVQLD